MSKVHTIRSVIFDLDGVIIDSNAEIKLFWKWWAEKEQVPFNDTIVKKHILGRTTAETVTAMFSSSSEDARAEILEAAKDFDIAMRPKLLKGLDLFLEGLINAAVPVALVTSSPGQRVKKLLEMNGVHHYFGNMVTEDDVTHGKPHPEPYLLMASRLKIDPVQCLVFEDSDSGIESALAAGMNVLAIGNDNYSEVVATIEDYEGLLIEKKQLRSHQKDFPKLVLI